MPRPATISFILADRDTWSKSTKTAGGDDMVLVATQASRRARGGRTTYVFWRRNTCNVYYTQSRNGVVFRPMARDEADMDRYMGAFVRAPLTSAERAWLVQNNYEMVGDRRAVQ